MGAFMTSSSLQMFLERVAMFVMLVKQLLDAVVVVMRLSRIANW